MNGMGTYQTGFAQRYATNPDLARHGQTLGHHQWGVATLLLTLFPDCRKEVLVEALLHDTGEPGVGCDMAAPAKRRYPEIATALAMAEYIERRQIGTLVEDLTEIEQAQVILCDGLEAYLYVSVVAPWVLSGDGWPEMRAGLEQQAWGLDVAAAVIGLLREAGV